MNWYFKKEWTVEQVALHYLKLRKEHFGDAPTPYDSPFAVVVENQKIEPHQKVTGMCRQICEQYDEFIKNCPQNYPERYGGKLPGVDQYWEELAKEQNPDFTAQAELLEGVAPSWSPQMDIDNRLFDNNGGKDFIIRHPDGNKTTDDKVERYKANKANAAAKNNENYKLADPNSEKAKLLGKIQ
ncbi:MAG: hypothetical protein Q9202_005405 [Teloschistes flavicans]